jgi:antitoxin MazE
MTRITVGTWGKGMASGVLQDIGREAGLVDGEQVNIEIQKGDVVISKRLPPLSSEQQARGLAALGRIIERSKTVTLGNVTLQELIDETRRPKPPRPRCSASCKAAPTFLPYGGWKSPTSFETQ